MPNDLDVGTGLALSWFPMPFYKRRKSIMTSIIEVEGLTKSYGSLLVIWFFITFVGPELNWPEGVQSCQLSTIMARRCCTACPWGICCWCWLLL
jgi:hypothetical protein